MLAVLTVSFQTTLLQALETGLTAYWEVTPQRPLLSGINDVLSLETPLVIRAGQSTLDFNFEFGVAVVPEPSTSLLTGSFVGLVAFLRAVRICQRPRPEASRSAAG
jgi:hypothetical protein